MSALAPCVACEFGNHDGHVAWPVRPPEGGVGGVHCPCPGGCEPQPNPLLDALTESIEKARATRVTAPEGGAR